MNWSQFRDSVSNICLAGAVIACWSLTQEMASSSPFTVMTNIFVTEFAEFTETFRKNSNARCYHLFSDSRRLWQLLTRARVLMGRARGLSSRCSWRLKKSVPLCVRQTTHPSVETTGKRIRTSAPLSTMAAGLYCTFGKWILWEPEWSLVIIYPEMRSTGGSSIS